MRVITWNRDGSRIVDGLLGGDGADLGLVLGRSDMAERGVAVGDGGYSESGGAAESGRVPGDSGLGRTRADSSLLLQDERTGERGRN